MSAPIHVSDIDEALYWRHIAKQVQGLLKDQKPEEAKKLLDENLN